MEIVGDYRADGYAHLKGLLPRKVADAFLQKAAADLDDGQGSLGAFRQHQKVTGNETIEVYGYRYPPLAALLFGLTPAIAMLTGGDLLPSYCVLRLYREGDRCFVHSDRDACQHSLSLTLDYSDGESWPLDFAPAPIDRAEPIADDFEGSPYRSVAMEPGDAVLYQGIRYRHGRVLPNPNAWSAHVFLHWVDRTGPYAHAAFDGKAGAIRPAQFRLG